MHTVLGHFFRFPLRDCPFISLSKKHFYIARVGELSDKVLYYQLKTLLKII
jgi:hypothetical protein